MRKQPVTKVVQSQRWQRSFTLRRFGIAAIIAAIWLVPLVAASTWISQRGARPASAPATATAQITNGAILWEDDTQTTTAMGNVSLPATQQQYAIDPAFQAYYDGHAGEATLGEPVTISFPVRQGRIQFFTQGALLLPVSQQTATTATDGNELPGEVVSDGLVDNTTGIVRLPLLHALLTVGSELPIGGDDSPLTYARLRGATRAEAMVPAPANATVISADIGAPATATATAAVTSTTGPTGDVFVPGGVREHTVVGHVIPAAIWHYINDPSLSPDSWRVDFGSPLTEALSFTATVNGAPHAMLAQAFWQGALLVDTTAVDADGNPTITRLATGMDYLRTLGLPPVVIAANTSAWGSGDIAVLDAPATGKALIHTGVNFPLSLTGQAQWLSGDLWYSVGWRESKSSGNGWAPAVGLTLTSPGNKPAYAEFDVLSADLATYLSGLGKNAAAVVYDLSRGVYYTYNASGQFIMASSAKIPIMLTFLTMTEDQSREPDSNEMYLLQTMIENSNNDSAQALFDEIGGTVGMNNFLQRYHVTGVNPDPDAWGWSTTSPMAMVQMLTLLYQGKVLTSQDRTLALNLMEDIESDQQIGVGDTAPPGATVAMKDGWVPAPDGLWAMNSSGIVMVGKETYIISVYTQDEQALDTGWTITETVCGMVGKLLP